MVVEIDGGQVDGEVDQGDLQVMFLDNFPRKYSTLPLYLLNDGVVDVVVTKMIDGFKLS